MTGRTVWVARTDPEPKNWTVAMPVGARVLTAQNQHGLLALWYECHPGSRLVDRVFRIVETGKEFDLPVNNAFVDTVQFAQGNYVLHVYEVTP